MNCYQIVPVYLSDLKKIPTMKLQTNQKPMVSILSVVNYNSYKIDLLNWCVSEIEVIYLPYWWREKAGLRFVLRNINFHFGDHKDRHSRFSIGRIKNLCPWVLAVLNNRPINAYPAWYFCCWDLLVIFLVWSAKLLLRSLQVELNPHKCAESP